MSKFNDGLLAALISDNLTNNTEYQQIIDGTISKVSSVVVGELIKFRNEGLNDTISFQVNYVSDSEFIRDKIRQAYIEGFNIAIREVNSTLKVDGKRELKEGIVQIVKKQLSKLFLK